MFRKDPNDILTQIDNYINQVWSSDGYSLSNTNQRAHTDMMTLTYEFINTYPQGSSMSREDNLTRLYDHINGFTQIKVENTYRNVIGMTDGDFLRFYELYWPDHKKISKVVCSTYYHLNRGIQQRRFFHVDHFYEIDVLVERIWETNFFKPLFPHIKQKCLSLIRINRTNHSPIDTQSIKKILLLYLDVDFIRARKEDIEYSSIQDFYTECFENEFLRDVKDYYGQQEIMPFEPNRVFEYLTSIGKYFHNEILWAKSYLPEEKSTLKKLMEILQEIFIPDNTFNRILEEVKPFVLNETNHQELMRLHEPINCITKLKDELFKFIQSHVYQTGNDNSRICNDRMTYIGTILNIHTSYSQLVRTIFSNEQDLIAALNQTCAKFIDNGTMESSNALAVLLFVHEADFDKKLNQILIILNYAEKEDFIRNFYEAMFSKKQNDVLHFYTSQWEIWKISDQDNWMKIFQKVLFQPLKDKVTNACLELIKAERNNEIINTELIEKIIESYLELGSSEGTANQSNTSTTLTIYKQFFEDPFIENTEQFYQIEAANFLSQNSVTEYLRKVAQRLDEEVHRVQSYLHSSTLSALIKKVEEVLIRDQLDVIYLESKALLRDELHQDLALLYKLVSRVPNATNELKKIVEHHIYEMGVNTIERVSGTAINDPKVYIETVIDIHKKFLKLVQEAFSGEQGFTAALDKACGKFINNNAVTRTAGTTTKSPELLARYCDALLRKGSKAVEETDLEEKFNQIMIVFNYIEDKDVFQKFYSKMLAKRLVSQLSASDDYEESMISKLKQACGFEYTSKLQRMFQDIGVSQTLIVEYKEYCETHHVVGIVDFTVMVLSSNSWPFSAQLNFVLPIELQSTYDSFAQFYTHRHDGRKLTWLHQHSMGELQTFFTSQKYILQVSTYQTAVLLLFNKEVCWTVEQIQDETQIKLELLLQVLLGLLKSRLLVCPDINEDELDEDFKDTDIKTIFSIRLATDFKSKKLRINLNIPLKAIEQKDIEGLHQTIDEDREMMIQAAIVRIMKARQTLKHELLMQEVIQQLSSCFRPKIPVIKKCIDILIEKEYLERQSNENDVLRFLT